MQHGEYVATAKPKPALTEQDSATMKKPKVLIVGAGIGGIMLGQLLLKGGVPFEIFERATEVKPLGSAMSLGSNISHVFRQLGIYEDFVAIGKRNVGWTSHYGENGEYTMELTSREPMCDAEEYVVTRPELYELLLRQIPKEMIHLNKKVLNFMQNDLGTMIRCNDGTSYHGDILVGADGAYSAVRQHLFKDLKSKKLLPASDDVPLPFDTNCLVGQTHVLDPEEFPELKLDHSQFQRNVQRNECATSVFTTKRGTICWGVIQFLNTTTSKEKDAFRNSEWGPEAAEAMCKQVRHFKVSCGKNNNMTLGDLIDRTPKNLISKVMLEEKVFDTWYGGRTVLIGDACHKLSPSGGAGAYSAIHDAVVLANWICSLETKAMPDIERTFKEYQDERHPVVLVAYKGSKLLKKQNEKSFAGAFIRYLHYRMPKWLWSRILKQSVLTRPQVSFLPLVEDKGSVPTLPQPSLHKTLPIIRARLEREKKEPEANAKTHSEFADVGGNDTARVVAV
ncbi:hypothetical protein BG004_005271 [Podila humilis]|nr:hypothetical protein BG004_005271 [Podila humilis]